MNVNKIIVLGTILFSMVINYTIFVSKVPIVFLLTTFFWPFLSFILAKEYQTNSSKTRSIIYVLFFSFHLMSIIVLYTLYETLGTEHVFVGSYVPSFERYIIEGSVFSLTIIGIFFLALYTIFFVDDDKNHSSVSTAVSLGSFLVFGVFIYNLFILFIRNIPSV